MNELDEIAGHNSLGHRQIYIYIYIELGLYIELGSPWTLTTLHFQPAVTNLNMSASSNQPIPSQALPLFPYTVMPTPYIYTYSSPSSSMEASPRVASSKASFPALLNFM